MRLAWFRRIPDASGDREGWIGRLCCRRSGPPVFFTAVLALPHRFFQFLLVVGKQGMDLTMCFFADCMNLRAEILARLIKGDAGASKARMGDYAVSEDTLK